MKTTTVREHESLSATRRTNLLRMLNPRSIAVVGASADPSKAGSQALRSLASFPGRIVAVHPREREVQGLSAYPTLGDVPEPVDLAVLAIPARHCVEAARDAARAGVGGIFIISGGFAESGDEGRALQEQLAEVCRTTGLRLLGPNTSGFINPHRSCVASFVPGVDRLTPGRVAVVAQSGGVNLTLAFQLHRLGEGISLAVGLGNAVDLAAADVLHMLAEDPNTSAIALHLEGVPQGRELYDTMRAVTAKKPVVAIAVGRSDIGAFAVSHTGNLMGSYQRTASALTQAGVVVVDTTEELAQAAAVLAAGRLPPKETSSFAVVTGQAGPGLLIVDGLKTAGLNVPQLGASTVQAIEKLLQPMTFLQNPVDTGRPGASFGEIVQIVAADAAIDATLVFALSEPSVLDPAQALKASVEADRCLVFGTLGLPEEVQPALAQLRAANVPAVLSPERVVLAARALAADARAQWRLLNAEPVNFSPNTPLRGTFDEARAKALLAQYGIATPQRRLCTSRDEAMTVFAQLTKPVVVKIAADDVPHKTDVGGVFLNVRSDAEFSAALDAIALIPTATPGRVLVEEMAAPGIELIVGGVRDASWGPCVVLGLGGVTAEALADSSVRLAPVTRVDVEEMIEGLRGKRLLEGFRNLPKADHDAICQAVIAIGRLLCEHPEVREVEINPLRVNAQGAVALDGLVLVDDTH